MNENELEETGSVVLEWQVTTTISRWRFAAYEEDGADIYDALEMFLADYDFDTMMADGTFLSVEATNTGASFRE